MTTVKTLGLVVNPIAGMGGRVGLKGTDGPDAVARARALGAIALSAERTGAALAIVAERLGEGVTVVAAPGEMGERIARAAGLPTRVVGQVVSGETTAGDTERLAGEIAASGIDLLLFAGGDGTARDVCRAVGTTLPVVGIPTGVKMHSAVFAANPRAAGELAVRFLNQPTLRRRESEVMDIDEEAFRAGRVSARLYGYLSVPRERGLVQSLKSSDRGEEEALGAIAAEIAERMGDGALWIVGPGTTTRAIAERLGAPKTLLGVDLFSRGELVAADATEATILRHLEAPAPPSWIVVTPIGGQGYVFGRGNQQFSPAVIRRIGRERIVVVATAAKLATLRGGPLLVDTGDAALDASLAGYVRVVTGYRTDVAYRVAS